MVAGIFRASLRRFAPVAIGTDISKLPEDERQALAKLVEAARLMDALFLRQSWAGSDALLMQLVGDTTPLGRARLHYFMINKGPWSRLDRNAPFLTGVPNKPEAGNFYPAGANKGEVEAWMKSRPEAEQAAARGFFTTIRAGPTARWLRCRTASSTRASSRARPSCCAKRRPSPSSPPSRTS